MDISILEELVSEFRGSLQKLVSSGNCFNLFFFKNYPFAACDNSSMLLARYLSEKGFPGAIRVFGDKGGLKGELGGHVWLKLDRLLIDITGSQFEGYDQSEIVIGETDGFLATFEVDCGSELADYRLCLNLENRSDFNDAYEAVIKQINTRC